MVATKPKAKKQSKQQTLSTFWGGFLYNNFCPLEVVLNRCSHSCAYCFANLAMGDRESNIKQALNLLATLWDTDEKGQFKKKTYASYLLREGYPVCLSNRIDMLAASNWFQAKPLIEMMIEMDIPISYATRFGKPEWTEEFFAMETRPSSIYCSVTTLNEDIVHKLEPGAPMPLERLEYIRRAVDMGHTVNVGINPVCPGWIDDPDEIAKAVKDAGAHGVYIQKLHFSHAQVKKMSDRQKNDLGDLIHAGLNYKTRTDVHELYDAVWNSCKEQGLWTYNAQHGEYSEYFEPALQMIPRTFPMMQEFVNACHTNLEPGDYIFWEDFRDFFVPALPPGVWGLRDHLNALVLPQVLHGKYIPQRMTYEKLLWHSWRHKETILCPANVECFAWAGDPVDEKERDWVGVDDDNGNPIMVFCPEGTGNSCFTQKHDL